MEKITVCIDAAGNVTMHVEGVKGSDCTIITAGVEAQLGGRAEHTYTDEYFEQPESESSDEQAWT